MASPAPLRRARRALAMAFIAVLVLPAGQALACTRLGPVGSVGNDCRRAPSTPTNSASTTPSSAEEASLRYLNRERERRGLRPLRIDSRARDIARDHARRMARKGELYHNKWLKSPDGRRALGWPSWLGENVGVGQSTRKVHKALMESKGHRENILFSHYTMVGVGAYVKGKNVWITQVYLSRTPTRRSAGTGTIARPPTGSQQRTAALPEADPSSPSPRPLLAMEGDGPATEVVAEGLIGGGSAVLAWSLGLTAFGLPAALHALTRRRRGTSSAAWDDWP